MFKKISKDELIDETFVNLTRIICESNAISLHNTLELLSNYHVIKKRSHIKKVVDEFRILLSQYQQNMIPINDILEHPVASALFKFFKNFPLTYKEEHIHLTGSLTADFIYPHLKKLLEGPNKEIYENKIRKVYGDSALPIKSVDDVDKLIRLPEKDHFSRYLEILLLPKLILTTKEIHHQAAFSMATDLNEKYNVGLLRLKFTLSRSTDNEMEKIPGMDEVTGEDVVLGLYEGFMEYKKQNPNFNFILAPSFRKEEEHFDSTIFKTKKDDIAAQIDYILKLIEKHPQLAPHLNEVDTVGDEKELYRKKHFFQYYRGFRKLHYKGFKIRSHHGETWHTLRKGIQAVDNAMNIWHIDVLEHGLSLGLNPNYYFHSLFQRIIELNHKEIPIDRNKSEGKELDDFDWYPHEDIYQKLLKGEKLSDDEITSFVKIKFHSAREVEQYQHDILNRMITKRVALTALPSSNQRLTKYFPDHKNHPFSWWEKKGVELGVGTDNYITLSTNFIREMLIILFSDPINLKIMKLLMVTTGEKRRPYLSNLLWQMRVKLEHRLTNH